jgi:hypothetical protein
MHYGELPKLFNIQETPTYYILNRKGHIAGRKLSQKDLSEVIGQSLSK